MQTKKEKIILWFKDIKIEDVPLVGGKNASLGEMIKNLTPHGINIPDGFALTAYAFRLFLKETHLDNFIEEKLKDLNPQNIRQLKKVGLEIREAIKKAKIPQMLQEEIEKNYALLEKKYFKNVDVAVRSSATAEDLPGASFAGEHETYLNIRGKEALIKAIQNCFASLFTDRAISYRANKGFDHNKVALSVGVQKMVRSDKGASGVMFTLDTESGFKDVVLINGSWGLGEMIVQGEVTPDEFLVWKPGLENMKLNPIIDKKLGVKDRKMIYNVNSSKKPTKIVNTSDKEKNSFVLQDEEIIKLAKWGILIEKHYTAKHKKWTPMDIEWAKDGLTGELFIVQARPETVQSSRDFSKIKEFERLENGKLLTKGFSVGSSIVSGKARVILSVKEIYSFKKGEILVTDMTDPDWEPIMKIASAIVTNKGGRTSHAAIVSRELGIPCIVGTENATRVIKTGDIITVDTTGTEGLVFKGALKFKVEERDIKKLPKPKVKIMVNIATPDSAFEKSFLPVDGVGLAREEFIIGGEIGIHPMTLIEYEKIAKRDKYLAKLIEKKTIGWRDKKDFYVDKLAYGIAKIAAAFYPREVIVRFSDFKTNEYRSLLGGKYYEPDEENPMIGWRGASRYYSPYFAPAFALEVKAIKKVREEMGLTNVVPMIPFCRTKEEGEKVLEIMKKEGLERGKNGLKVYVMCEIPSNVVLAEEFLEIFDGMSIGSNDLTQLTLGIDRDGNERIRSIANENNEAVKKLIASVIEVCKKKKKYIGICGQAPSDYPEFAEFLLQNKIDSISLNPDVVIKTILKLAQK
jgi:pyruvate,water dikinase